MKTIRISPGSRISQMYKQRSFYLMLVPGVLVFIAFKYLPMFGLITAFQDYQPVKGVWHSNWAGIEHFTRFFTEPTFWRLTKNTFSIAILSTVFFFPIPIMLAVLLNEIRISSVKRIIQSFVYIPHFVSWVVVYGLLFALFTSDGLVNLILEHFGWRPVSPLTNPGLFKVMIILEQIWKESGWNSIIILAAITGIDPGLYQAAEVDGAGRFRKIWHVTLPGIMGTVIILFLLRLGSFLDTGFEQILLHLNALNRNVGEVYDTFVYQYGVLSGQFSYATTVGLFKSVVGLAIVMVTNRIVNRMGQEGLY